MIWLDLARVVGVALYTCCSGNTAVQVNNWSFSRTCCSDSRTEKYIVCRSKLLLVFVLNLALVVSVALYTCCCGNSCCSSRRSDDSWSCTWSWCSGSSKSSCKVSSTFHSSIRSRPCWGGRCCPPYTLPSIQRPTCRWCVLFSSRSTRTFWKYVWHYIFIKMNNYWGFKLWPWSYCWQMYRNSCI